MGTTKTEIYTEAHNDLANLFKVLGHPARIAILHHIMNQNACICTDLVGELGLAQATISQHLKELKNIGLIKGSIEGKSVCYCIDEDVWSQMQNELLTFFKNDVQSKKCC